MFETITMLIDNDTYLLEKFIGIAIRNLNSEYDCADEMREWFEIQDHYVAVDLLDAPINEETSAIKLLFKSILSQAIADIGEDDWLEIANRYMTKAQERKR